MNAILAIVANEDFTMSSVEPMRRRAGRDASNVRDRGTKREVIREMRRPRSGHTTKRAGLIEAARDDGRI